MCTAFLRSNAWPLTLMKSADRVRNQVIALEVLCSPGLFDPPV
jgi:hypothetical protein